MGKKIKPQVGMKLYGYCNGYFGRDSYGDKIIETVAYDYIVVRSDGVAEFFGNYDCSAIEIDEDWMIENEDDD